MDNNHEDLGPILEMRHKLDRAIQGYMEKVTALRKRREAIQSALDVLRTSDDELMSNAPSAKGSDQNKRRVVDFDTIGIEQQVLAILSDKQRYAFLWICEKLTSQGLVYSKAGLRRILATCPRITRVGVRDTTRYFIE